MVGRGLVILSLLLGALVTGPAIADDKRVVLGFASALTGPYAVTGQADRDAFQAAVRDVNAAGGVLGRRVEGRVVDDACGIDQAVEAARTLLEADAKAVVGHMCSHSSLMAAGLYDAASVPMLTPVSTHPRLTEEGRKNVFRLIGRDDDQAAFAADLIEKTWPKARLAILHDDSVYGEGLARETRAELRARGLDEVLYQNYEPDRPDYTSLATHLADVGAEVAFVGGYGPDAGRIVLAAARAGLQVQFLGGDGLGMDSFWETAGAHGEGTLFSDRRIDGRAPPPALIERPYRHPHASEFSTYAAVQVWAEAVRRAGGLEPRRVLRELTRGRFATVTGTVDFDPKGDLRGAVWTWHLWRAGQRVSLEPPLSQ